MKNIDLETTYTDMDYIQNQINLFLSHVDIANVILKKFKDVEDNIHKMDINYLYLITKMNLIKYFVKTIKCYNYEFYSWN